MTPDDRAFLEEMASHAGPFGRVNMECADLKRLIGMIPRDAKAVDDASTPLPLSLADRSQWQQEAENAIAGTNWAPLSEPHRRILVLLSALQKWEDAADQFTVVNWIGIYKDGNEPYVTFCQCIENALDQERDNLKARAEAAEALVAQRDDKLADEVTRLRQSLAALTREKETLQARIDSWEDAVALDALRIENQRLTAAYESLKGEHIKLQHNLQTLVCENCDYYAYSGDV